MQYGAFGPEITALKGGFSTIGFGNTTDGRYARFANGDIGRSIVFLTDNADNKVEIYYYLVSDYTSEDLFSAQSPDLFAA